MCQRHHNSITESYPELWFHPGDGLPRTLVVLITNIVVHPGDVLPRTLVQTLTRLPHRGICGVYFVFGALTVT